MSDENKDLDRINKYNLDISKKVEITDKEENQSLINDPEEILVIFKKIIRDKVEFSLIINKKEFKNNKVVSISDNKIFVENPFFGNSDISIPEHIECYLYLYGIRYSFNLFRKDDDDKEVIPCEFVKEINVIEKRRSNRVHDFQKPFNIGIFWAEAKKEFFGEVINISKNGLKIKFNENNFGYDLYSNISSSENMKIKIMININDSYQIYEIIIKNIFNDILEEKIIIQAEFSFYSNENYDLLSTLVENLNATSRLIEKQKRTVDFIENRKI
jgi:hypothetical protein